MQHIGACLREEKNYRKYRSNIWDFQNEVNGDFQNEVNGKSFYVYLIKNLAYILPAQTVI